MSRPRLDAITKAQLERPKPVRGRVLLDTGASCSCVDQAITEQLKLDPRGQEDVVTPSTGSGHHTVTQYDLAVIIPPGRPNDSPLVLDTVHVIHAELLAKQGIHGLLGRDVLRRCIFHYNGSGYFSLAW